MVNVISLFPLPLCDLLSFNASACLSLRDCASKAHFGSGTGAGSTATGTRGLGSMMLFDTLLLLSLLLIDKAEDLRIHNSSVSISRGPSSLMV